MRSDAFIVLSSRLNLIDDATEAITLYRSYKPVEGKRFVLFLRDVSVDLLG